MTFVNTESFAGDEGVKQVKIDFHAEVKGGAYRLQNFVTTIGLTANEDNVTHGLTVWELTMERI